MNKNSWKIAALAGISVAAVSKGMNKTDHENSDGTGKRAARAEQKKMA